MNKFICEIIYSPLFGSYAYYYDT